MLMARKRGMLGLTLLELLTTICIIALLASIIVPRFWKANSSATYAGCAENLRNVATAVIAYQSENAERYPPNLGVCTPHYINRIPTCPAAQVDTYSASYRLSSDLAVFTIFCQGSYHDSDIPNIPWYSSDRGLGPSF